MPPERVKIFISSRQGGLFRYIREEVCRILEDMGYEVTMFERFPAQTVGPKEAYKSKVEEADAVIVILGNEYSEAVEEEFSVALKKGKPVFVFIDENAEVDDKQKGFIEKVKKKVVCNYFKSLNELKKSIKNALQAWIANKVRSPAITQTSRELYELLTKIIERSQRVTQLARTPILVFGPRPYGEAHSPLDYEEENYQATLCLVNDAINGKRSFTLIISSYETLEEVKKEGKRYAKKVLDNIKKWLELAKKRESKFKIHATPLNETMPLPFIIGDEECAVWLRKNPRAEVSCCIKGNWGALRQALNGMALYYVEEDRNHKNLRKLIKEIEKYLKEQGEENES